MTDTSANSRDVQAYVLQRIPTRRESGNLTESTALITGGILDSIGTLKLVGFLEEKYRIQVEAARGLRGPFQHHCGHCELCLLQAAKRLITHKEPHNNRRRDPRQSLH
jgi:acyl carrier protein